MIDTKSYFKINYSNEKKFGFLFSFIFFIISIYPLFFNDSLIVWSLLISVIFLLISLIYSKLLILPNKLWIKFGTFLNQIVSPLIMFLIFVLTFYPIGILLKLFKKDLINQKIYYERKSYWVIRKNKMESLRKQF